MCNSDWWNEWVDTYLKALGEWCSLLMLIIKTKNIFMRTIFLGKNHWQYEIIND